MSEKSFFNIIFGRHGHKPESSRNPEDVAREKAIMPEDDRALWDTCQDHLDRFLDAKQGEHINPGIELRNVPLIRKKVYALYDELPKEATVIFTSTHYPRAFMTAALKSECLMDLAHTRGDKNIKVAFMRPMSSDLPAEDGQNVTETDSIASAVVRFMTEHGAPKSYLEGAGQHRIENENELVKKAMECDLYISDGKGNVILDAEGRKQPNPNSVMRARRDLLKKQIKHLNDDILKGVQGPVYVLVEGHHSNFVVAKLLLDEVMGILDHEQELTIPEPLDTQKIPGGVVEKM